MQLFERILLSVTILLGVQSFPLAAQWINTPEFNPSQEHAVVDGEFFAKMQTTAIFMGLAGLAAVPVGVYLFVYDAATTPGGQVFHPLQGKPVPDSFASRPGVRLLPAAMSCIAGEKAVSPSSEGCNIPIDNHSAC